MTIHWRREHLKLQRKGIRPDSDTAALDTRDQRCNDFRLSVGCCAAATVSESEPEAINCTCILSASRAFRRAHCQIGGNPSPVRRRRPVGRHGYFAHEQLESVPPAAPGHFLEARICTFDGLQVQVHDLPSSSYLNLKVEDREDFRLRLRVQVACLNPAFASF